MSRSRGPALRATAPVRADLAGGTLDLWPLGLFEPGAATVAVALSLRVEASVRPLRRGEPCLLRSVDLAREKRWVPGQPLRRGKLELLERVVRALAAPGTSFALETCSPVRAGSGLGTSSALGIAAAGLLCRWQRRAAPVRRLIPLVRDLEAQVLGIPTGTQDHAAAALGGVVVLTYPAGEVLYRRGPAAWTRALQSRLVLVDSGSGRSSAPSNWDMVRRRMEGETGAVRALAAVGRAGAQALQALESGDWRVLGRAMRADAEARAEWSPLVFTKALETIFGLARGAGALGWKVCGAGGGGYAALLVDPSRKAAVEEILWAGGYPPNPVAPSSRGFRISRRREAES